MIWWLVGIWFVFVGFPAVAWHFVYARKWTRAA
jgi:uncharacterized membrane protein HdeD (DUF308 family)